MITPSRSSDWAGREGLPLTAFADRPALGHDTLVNGSHLQFGLRFVGQTPSGNGRRLLWGCRGVRVARCEVLQERPVRRSFVDPLRRCAVGAGEIVPKLLRPRERGLSTATLRTLRESKSHAPYPEHRRDYRTAQSGPCYSRRRRMTAYSRRSSCYGLRVSCLNSGIKHISLKTKKRSNRKDGKAGTK